MYPAQGPQYLYAYIPLMGQQLQQLRQYIERTQSIQQLLQLHICIPIHEYPYHRQGSPRYICAYTNTHLPTTCIQGWYSCINVQLQMQCCMVLLLVCITTNRDHVALSCGAHLPMVGASIDIHSSTHTPSTPHSRVLHEYQYSGVQSQGYGCWGQIGHESQSTQSCYAQCICSY